MIAGCPLYKAKDLSVNPQDSYKGRVLVPDCNPSTRVVRRHADPQTPGMHLARVAKSESSRFIESSYVNRRQKDEGVRARHDIYTHDQHSEAYTMNETK